MPETPSEKNKLHLRNSDTNRFKVETGRFKIQHPGNPDPMAPAAPIPLPPDAGATQRAVNLNDPMSLRETSKGRLRKITDTGQTASLATPSAGTPLETVRLKVVRKPRPAGMGGAPMSSSPLPLSAAIKPVSLTAATPPPRLHLNLTASTPAATPAAAETQSAPEELAPAVPPRPSAALDTATAAIKLKPHARPEDLAPAGIRPAATPPAPAPAAPPAAKEPVAEAEPEAAPVPPRPSAVLDTATAAIKLKPSGHPSGIRPAGIRPAGIRPAAAPPAPAAPAPAAPPTAKEPVAEAEPEAAPVPPRPSAVLDTATAAIKLKPAGHPAGIRPAGIRPAGIRPAAAPPSPAAPAPAAPPAAKEPVAEAEPEAAPLPPRPSAVLDTATAAIKLKPAGHPAGIRPAGIRPAAPSAGAEGHRPGLSLRKAGEAPAGAGAGAKARHASETTAAGPGEIPGARSEAAAPAAVGATGITPGQPVKPIIDTSTIKLNLKRKPAAPAPVASNAAATTSAPGQAAPAPDGKADPLHLAKPRPGELPRNAAATVAVAAPPLPGSAAGGGAAATLSVPAPGEGGENAASEAEGKPHGLHLKKQASATIAVPPPGAPGNPETPPAQEGDSHGRKLKFGKRKAQDTIAVPPPSAPGKPAAPGKAPAKAPGKAAAPRMPEAAPQESGGGFLESASALVAAIAAAVTVVSYILALLKM